MFKFKLKFPLNTSTLEATKFVFQYQKVAQNILSITNEHYWTRYITLKPEEKNGLSKVSNACKEKQMRSIFTGWNINVQSTEWWLNGGWMETEWWWEWWISVAYQSSFSDPSVEWMAGTFQWPFSQLLFFFEKLSPTRLEPEMQESKGKYTNHSSTGTVN